MEPFLVTAENMVGGGYVVKIVVEMKEIMTEMKEPVAKILVEEKLVADDGDCGKREGDCPRTSSLWGPSS